MVTKPTSGKVDSVQILDILQKIKRVSEEDRNPAWGDNPRRSQCGKVCNNAAAASDLGSTRRNHVTRDLRTLVRLGYLIEINDESYGNYVFFRLSPQGQSFIETHTKK